MDELMNTMLDRGASASDVSDKIKDMLFAKSAKRVDDVKPNVSSSMFDKSESETENEVDQEEESNGD